MINPSAALLRKIREQICERGRLCAAESLQITRFGPDDDDDAESVIVTFPASGKVWQVKVTSPESAPPLGRAELCGAVSGPLQDETWDRIRAAVMPQAA
jgi:hypothetical protein